MSFEDLKDLAQSLGVFQWLKKKLIAQPDAAAKNLADVLEKLAETFKAIDDELNKYLSISFDKNNPNQIAEAKKALIELKGGKVAKEVGQARVHCAEIGPIYDAYLDKWFKRVFDKSEYDASRGLFRSLGTCDNRLVCIIESLDSWLTDNAKNVKKMLDEENYASAVKKLQDDESSITPVREQLSQTIRQLYELEAEFVKVSKTII